MVSRLAALGATLLLGATAAHAEEFKGKISPDAKMAQPAWPERVTAPKGAPNVIVILLDDVGFGAASTFGGAVSTPALDKLAAEGVRYNRFHTTAICSPTRASLLTGRNAHQVGFGVVSDVHAGFPGYNAIWDKDTASVAKVLKDSGYNTAAFGKWHNTPNWEISDAGPFDRWPTGLGFEYFYGFMFGETSEWEPRLYRGISPVEHEPSADYHLTTDLADDAIRWVHRQQAVAHGKPFFMYFAPGATHAPLHAPKAFIDPYKGKFDQGWDELRKEIIARQKKAGLIPASTDLTPRPAEIPAWASLTADHKRLYARQMEVFAGYLAHTDHEIGRLLDDLRENGIADNTLVLYVVGDNGGSAEGGLEGSDINLSMLAGGAKQTVEDQLPHMADLGGPLYDNHFSAAWAWATNSPFQWMKQVASHLGGTRNGFVAAWPGHTAQPGTVRSQFSHVNDIAPTIYAAAGVPFPETVDGVTQVPLEGKSLLPTFADPKAPEHKTEQYFEVYGHRAIYKDGWMASARRVVPWEGFQNRGLVYRGEFEKDRWELYNLTKDYSQAHDLAAKYPDKLKELQAAFDKEAWRNDVYPLTPTPFVGAPTLNPRDKTRFVYLSGADRIPLAATPSLSGRSFRITADLDAAKASEGVIVAGGGRYGGYSLYVKDGVLTFANNTMAIIHETVTSSQPLPGGKVQVSVVFRSDPPPASVVTQVSPLRGSRAAPGTAELYIGDQKVGEARFSKFGAFTSSITESFDVGKDTGAPVTDAYAGPFAFNGQVKRVTVDLLP